MRIKRTKTNIVFVSGLILLFLLFILSGCGENAGGRDNAQLKLDLLQDMIENAVADGIGPSAFNQEVAAENGTAQSAPNQEVAAENGIAQSAPNQEVAAENGTAQSAPNQEETAENGTAQDEIYHKLETSYGFPFRLRKPEGMELYNICIYKDYAIYEWCSDCEQVKYEDLSWNISENRLYLTGEWTDSFLLDLEAETATSETTGRVYQIAQGLGCEN